MGYDYYEWEVLLQIHYNNILQFFNWIYAIQIVETYNRDVVVWF